MDLYIHIYIYISVDLLAQVHMHLELALVCWFFPVPVLPDAKSIATALQLFAADSLHEKESEIAMAKKDCEPIKKRPASYDATPPRKKRAVTAAELAMIAGVPVDEAGELTPQSATATLTPNSWTGMFSPWTDDESP